MRRCSLARLCGAGALMPRAAGRQREPIEAALPDHALAADLAAHQRRELPRDRQPEPGAAHLACRAVDLERRGWNSRSCTVLAQADAGVGHVEAQHEPAVDFAGARMQAHRAFRGELQRVVDQADQDLAEPRGDRRRRSAGSWRRYRRRW